MKQTIFVNEEHLGKDATREQAVALVALLNKRGYEEVKYGRGGPWVFDPEEDDAAHERDVETIRAAFECAFDSALADVLENERVNEAESDYLSECARRSRDF